MHWNEYFLSFEDYIECRGLVFIVTVLLSEQFDIIFKHVNELEIDIFDFILELWNWLNNSDNKASRVYKQYLKESRDELWESPEAVNDIFRKMKIIKNY